MQKYLLMGLLIAFGMQLHGQQAENPSVEKGQWVINFLPISPSYEIGLSPTTTLALKGGVSLIYLYVPDDGGKVELGLSPYLMADYRYYYNLDKRAIKGRQTAHNSGNFLALTSMFSGPPFKGKYINPDYVWLAGPAWGIQRTYWNRLNLTVALGAGAYKLQGYDVIFSPIINYSLGIRLGK